MIKVINLDCNGKPVDISRVVIHVDDFPATVAAVARIAEVTAERKAEPA